MNDTIFGLATPPGRAAIAILRCSGPLARATVTSLAGRAPAARRAVRRSLRDAQGALLDDAMVLWFPAPHSYTGEDCLELHLHGGAAVVDGVAAALLAAGLRMAEPGEFTRRAFSNGKMDLTRAEAVADLVDAESRAQVRQALAQADGALARQYGIWRSEILASLALLEGAVDFAEDVDQSALAGKAAIPLARLIKEVGEAVADAPRGRRVREGYRVAIIGPPNAGKSSLLNRLLRRPAAIVTSVAGATRDVLEHPLDVRGYRVLVADTAGLRQASETVEREGVRRAARWAGGADLRLLVVDRRASCLTDHSRTLLRTGDFILLNKSDLPSGVDEATARTWAAAISGPVFKLRLARGRDAGGEDWGAFEAALAERVVHDCGVGDFPAATRARHLRLLREAHEHLCRAAGALAHVELAAEDVRLAARALSRLTGEIGVEDMLGEVFGRFCIGK